MSYKNENGRKGCTLFFVCKGFKTVDQSCRSSMMAALHAVQRFLVRKGYKRGRKKGSQHYRLREKNLIMRDKYVKRMVEEDNLKTQRIVYMDKSYIHKNYCHHEDSLYDPNDEQDLTTVAMHKGQQYCFIAAIVDADHTIPEESRTTEQKAGLLMDTLDIFEGGKKQTKDYHGMFDHHYFVAWMGKLPAALRSRNITNAIIVMDNAKYHKKFPKIHPERIIRNQGYKKLVQNMVLLSICWTQKLYCGKSYMDTSKKTSFLLW